MEQKICKKECAWCENVDFEINFCILQKFAYICIKNNEKYCNFCAKIVYLHKKGVPYGTGYSFRTYRQQGQGKF